MQKLGTKKTLRIIILITVAIVVLFYVFFIPTTSVLRYSTFFTINNLRNIDETYSFINQELPINETSLDEVTAFTDKNGFDCTEFEDDIAGLNESELVLGCAIVITDTSFYGGKNGLIGVFELFALNTRVAVGFVFTEGILTDIDVKMHFLSV